MTCSSVQGHRVVLYPLASEHIEVYLTNYSACVQKLLYVHDLFYERAYLQERLNDKDAFFYVIFAKLHHTFLGAIEIRTPFYRSQLYCWLNERYWGKGYFQEAMLLVAEQYFQASGEHCIMARIDCTNRRSFQALKKVGFEQIALVQGSYGPQYEMILRV